MGSNLPVSSAMWFSRQEYWSGLSCPPPGIFLTQGSNPCLLQLPTLQADFFFFFFFTTEPPGKPIVVRLLSHVWRFATPWTAAHQAPHPSQSPGVCSNSCSLSWWCHPNVSSSVLPSSPSSFPASESFLVSRPFTSGGQSIGASA